MRSALQQAVAALTDAGASVVRVSLSALRLALPCYYVLACAEASSNLQRYDGLRYGHPVKPETTDVNPASDLTALHTAIARCRGEGFGAEVIRRLLVGTMVLSEGSRSDFFESASAVRATLVSQMEAALAPSRVDALLMPTVAKLPFVASSLPGPADMLTYDLLTVPANLAGMPAISVPFGATNGRPVGMQLVAPRHHEACLLSIAYALEERTP